MLHWKTCQFITEILSIIAAILERIYITFFSPVTALISTTHILSLCPSCCKKNLMLTNSFKSYDEGYR